MFKNIYINPNSFIDEVLYDVVDHTMLVVINGKKYEYSDISEEVLNELKNAKNPGVFYNKFIKKDSNHSIITQILDDNQIEDIFNVIKSYDNKIKNMLKSYVSDDIIRIILDENNSLNISCRKDAKYNDKLYTFYYLILDNTIGKITVLFDYKILNNSFKNSIFYMRTYPKVKIENDKIKDNFKSMIKEYISILQQNDFINNKKTGEI
jgi:uncharacterized protein YlzI (FlbEa/FlbD family)